MLQNVKNTQTGGHNCRVVVAELSRRGGGEAKEKHHKQLNNTRPKFSDFDAFYTKTKNTQFKHDNSNNPEPSHRASTLTHI